MKVIRSRSNIRSTRFAFTLVELLVVIVIIGVLVAMIFPVFSKMQEKSIMANDTSSLRQIGVATALYIGEHDQCLPTASVPIPGTDAVAGQGARWTYQEAIDRYMAPVPGFDASSIYNYNKRPKTWGSRAIKPYPGWKSTDVRQTGPLAFGYNPNMDDPKQNWARGNLLLVPDQSLTGLPFGPSKLVIMGETNDRGMVLPDQPATTANNVQCGYRISRLDGQALYLFADFHVETLKGDRGYSYFASHPTEANMWKWW